MKLPAFCPKVRLGQHWAKKDGMSAGKVIEITGRARDRKGQTFWHSKVVGNPKAKSHGISQKTLWRFYELL